MKSRFRSCRGARSRFSQPEQRKARSIHGELSSLKLARMLQRNNLHFFVFKKCTPNPHDLRRQVLPQSSVSYLDWGICEWQCIDGAAYLPKAESAVVPLIGYLDPRCAGEIPSCREKSGKNSFRTHRSSGMGKRVHDANGAAITQTASCGGFGGKTGLYLCGLQ